MKKLAVGALMTLCAMGAHAELGQTYQGTIVQVGVDTRTGSSYEGGMSVVLEIPSALSAGCDFSDSEHNYAVGAITATSAHLDRLITQLNAARAQSLPVSIEVDLEADCKLMNVTF